MHLSARKVEPRALTHNYPRHWGPNNLVPSPTPPRGSDTAAAMAKLASAMTPVAQVVPHRLDKAYEVGVILCKGPVPGRRARKRPTSARRRRTRRVALRGVLLAEMLRVGAVRGAAAGSLRTSEGHGSTVSLVVRVVVREGVWSWAFDERPSSLVLLLLVLLVFVLLAVLTRHHGKGGGGQTGGQAALNEVLGGVLLGVGELDELVGGEGGGCEADGEVDALAEADVLEGVEGVALFALIVVAHWCSIGAW